MSTTYGTSRTSRPHRVYRPMANFRTNTASPFRHVDLVLVGCVFAVSLFGAVMVYSTTRGPTAPYDAGYLKRVLVFIVLGGALMGATEAEAFFVKCDRTTMTQDDIDNGRLICYIGVAPVKPAEFVIFRISQFTATTNS